MGGMKMLRNKAILATLVMFAITSLMGLAYAPQAKAAEGPIVMRIGTPTAGEHPQVWEMNEFKKRIEGKLGAKIKVELYPASQLGTDAQQRQALLAGSLQGFLQPTSFLTGLDPALTINDLPYLFKDTETGVKILNGPAGDKLRARVEKIGIVIPSFFVAGDRIQILTSSVKDMQQLKGKKIRTISKLLQDQHEAWGAKGVSLDTSEVYMALQQHTIDGVESDAPFFFATKLYNAAKYLLMAPKGCEVTVFMLSKKWLDTLPQDVRNAVVSTVKEMTPAANEYARNFGTKAQAEMVKAGVTVIEPSPEFDAKLRAAAPAIADKFIKEYPDLKPFVDELRAAAAK
jgi:tripartite ATP-independent transporter DctP family solute receptor